MCRTEIDIRAEQSDERKTNQLARVLGTFTVGCPFIATRRGLFSEEMGLPVITINPAFQALIPPLPDEVFALLEANILSDGCRDPLVTWKDTLLDGHNRFDICQRHGLPFTTVVVDLPDETAAMDWIDANQLGRRNLTADQRSIIRGRLYNRQKLTHGGAREASGQTVRLKTSETLAAQHRVTERTIRRDGQRAEALEQLAQTHPEEAKAVLDGTKKFNEVRRTARLTKVVATAKLPSGKFRVFYADPPWKYRDQLTADYGPARLHYPSMTVAELCALPIRDLSEENAVLFLWVTSPMLAECWPVIESWDFTYKSSFVWDKRGHNLGHYNSIRHEFLLVCTRGSCLPDVKKLFDSVQSIERKKHSEKPERFRKIIETLYPHGKRLELFARKHIKNWTVYGNTAAIN